ncbi:Aste57867_6937 [Aphanomyces stellatus]|uniref:Aste57867_6937 protein n=1 Tax=Aphanomyces stellatus TaxID=120398 RepID=A0A485KHS4_9STRA|nr:hypothetical protein As57867_006915 [Aphanomyces stellatus]VFT83889.1 Aste57867_6937 [Aphanomyces stellatus]
MVHLPTPSPTGGMKRAMQNGGGGIGARDGGVTPKVPILYPRPDFAMQQEGSIAYAPPSWDQPPMMHNLPPATNLHPSNGPIAVLPHPHEYADPHAQTGKRPRWADHDSTSAPSTVAWLPRTEQLRRRDELPPMYPTPTPIAPGTQQPAATIAVATGGADSDNSSDVEGESNSPVDKEDDEPLKKLHGKKRNRMKDEIDALRKEVGSMTRHLDWLRVSQESQQGRRQPPLWADIARQQAHELSRVVAENQHLRQTLEEHLDIAQEYLDTIIPKNPHMMPSPPQNVAAPPADVSSLPIIMCL